jgi:hypothetical protein
LLFLAVTQWCSIPEEQKTSTTLQQKPEIWHYTFILNLNQVMFLTNFCSIFQNEIYHMR